jgi:hypothetical protein
MNRLCKLCKSGVRQCGESSWQDLDDTDWPTFD